MLVRSGGGGRGEWISPPFGNTGMWAAVQRSVLRAIGRQARRVTSPVRGGRPHQRSEPSVAKEKTCGQYCKKQDESIPTSSPDPATSGHDRESPDFPAFVGAPVSRGWTGARVAPTASGLSIPAAVSIARHNFRLTRETLRRMQGIPLPREAKHSFVGYQQMHGAVVGLDRYCVDDLLIEGQGAGDAVEVRVGEKPVV